MRRSIGSPGKCARRSGRMADGAKGSPRLGGAGGVPLGTRRGGVPKAHAKAPGAGRGSGGPMLRRSASGHSAALGGRQGGSKVACKVGTGSSGAQGALVARTRSGCINFRRATWSVAYLTIGAFYAGVCSSDRPDGLAIAAVSLPPPDITSPPVELVAQGFRRGWRFVHWRDRWGRWLWGHCVPSWHGYDRPPVGHRRCRLPL